MKFLIRADGSTQMGSGHISRCLTLATRLTERGGEVQFICREHEGHLNEYIESKGFIAHGIPLRNVSVSSLDEPVLDQHLWVGSTWQEDAQDCEPIVAAYRPDWMIVDHYGLDFRWQNQLRSGFGKLMVIDDMANRFHHCDLLLDQTYGRQKKDYQPWVPPEAVLALGSNYSLLRPEFAQWREASLSYRSKSTLDRVFINMGGVDPENVTGQLLEALSTASLPKSLHLTVVLGATAPWIEQVRDVAKQLYCQVEIVVGAENMAELMSSCDLALGAAGSTTWERCCLGLPSIVFVLSDNQAQIARWLEEAGAVINVAFPENLSHLVQQVIPELVAHPERLNPMIQASKQITDGRGCDVVCDLLER